MWNLSSWDILRVSALSIIRLVKYLSLENDFTRQISLLEAEIIFGLRWMVWDIRNAEFFNQLRYLKGLPTSDKQINPNNISSLPITNTFTLYDRINYLKWKVIKRVEWLQCVIWRVQVLNGMRFCSGWEIKKMQLNFLCEYKWFF